MSLEPEKVFYLKRSKRFTLVEAKSILPRIQEVTRQAVEDTAPLMDELQQDILESSQREELSKRLQKRVDAWIEEVSKLGAVAKGLWLVDFDSGSGFYCWVYGEDDIEFFHSYKDGFSGRTRIQ